MHRRRRDKMSALLRDKAPRRRHHPSLPRNHIPEAEVVPLDPAVPLPVPPSTKAVCIPLTVAGTTWPRFPAEGRLPQRASTSCPPPGDRNPEALHPRGQRDTKERDEKATFCLCYGSWDKSGTVSLRLLRCLQAHCLLRKSCRSYASWTGSAPRLTLYSALTMYVKQVSCRVATVANGRVFGHQVCRG